MCNKYMKNMITTDIYTNKKTAGSRKFLVAWWGGGVEGVESPRWHKACLKTSILGDEKLERKTPPAGCRTRHEAGSRIPACVAKTSHCCRRVTSSTDANSLSCVLAAIEQQGEEHFTAEMWGFMLSHVFCHLNSLTVQEKLASKIQF